MNFVTWSIRNPVPALMLFVVLLVGGVMGFRSLGIQDRPDITLPYVTVSMSYPGTPPEQIETEITRKIEDAVANVVGVRHISSEVSQGLSLTTIELQIDTDVPQAVDDVRDAVTRLRPTLPADALEPAVSRATTAGFPILTYSVSAPNLSETELSWYVDQTIARRLSSIGGVGRVARIGGVDREIRVSLDPDRMNALGATASDVSRQLKLIQADLPAGTSRVGGQEQTVRALGTISSTAELAHLDAIATVTDQEADRRTLALLDGRPVVGFSVTRAWGASADGVARGVEAAVAELRKARPGMQISVIDDSSIQQVRESYRSSMEMLIEGALLAILVVWLFLRDWRATVISASALPLAIIPTFLGMAVMGYTLNLLSLLALSLVVGMLVDDAIVEVENIVRHLRMGKAPLDAATDAAVEIGLAVVATTLALCAVFTPVAFLSGIFGQFFRPFAFTATLAVLFSLLVARLLTPAMAAYFMRAHPHDSEPRFLRRYLRAVEWCLVHQRTTLITATVAFVAAISLGAFLPSSFAPASDIGASQLQVELPPGSTLGQTRAATEQVRARIAAMPQVERVFCVIGDGTQVRTATVTVVWKPRKVRKLPSSVLQTRALRATADLPGLRVATSQFGGNSLNFALVGDNAGQLADAAQRVTRDLQAQPGLAAVSTNASLLDPEIVIRPMPDRAAEMGVTTEAMSTAVRFATTGDVDVGLPKMNLPDRQVPIRVRLDDSARADIARLRLLPVPGRNGAVPLANVATLRFDSAPASISRYDRSRNVNVSADLAGMSLGEATALVDRLPSMQQLPPGVHKLDTGDAQFYSELINGFVVAMIIGILCVYVLLVLLFHDFVQPITILSAIPPSVGGAYLFLWLFNYQVSVPSLIGMLTLMGIVTKNSILMVEYAVMARRDHGMSRHAAIIDACSKRVRPIVMTTIAMGAGMLPIALGLSGDPSFRSPMGTAVIGGLIASTALSLFVVPVVYTVVDEMEHRVRGWWRNSRFGGVFVQAPSPPIPTVESVISTRSAQRPRAVDQA
jgi:multidrug efflux pump subunit AcrB